MSSEAEVEKFNEELLKKQKGEYDLKQERLDAIYKNKDKYRNAKITERRENMRRLIARMTGSS